MVYSKTYDWSPVLACILNTVRLWELCLKKSKGQLVSPFRLQKLQNASNIDISDLPMVLTLPSIVRFLREARANLKEHKKHHRPLRQTHLGSLAAARVEKRSPELLHPSNIDKLEKAIDKELHNLRKRNGAGTCINK
jgi:hypothetical protein